MYAWAVACLKGAGTPRLRAWAKDLMKVAASPLHRPPTSMATTTRRVEGVEQLGSETGVDGCGGFVLPTSLEGSVNGGVRCRGRGRAVEDF